MARWQRLFLLIAAQPMNAAASNSDAKFRLPLGALGSLAAQGSIKRRILAMSDHRTRWLQQRLRREAEELPNSPPPPITELMAQLIRRHWGEICPPIRKQEEG